MDKPTDMLSLLRSVSRTSSTTSSSAPRSGQRNSQIGSLQSEPSKWRESAREREREYRCIARGAHTLAGTHPVQSRLKHCTSTAGSRKPQTASVESDRDSEREIRKNRGKINTHKQTDSTHTSAHVKREKGTAPSTAVPGSRGWRSTSCGRAAH